MTHAVNVRTDGSVRGSEGQLWERHGRRMVDAILTESGMPTSLNWSVQVRVAEHVKGQRAPFVLRGIDKATRRMMVRLTPATGNCSFDVSFTFSGEEIGWDVAAQRMEVAINRLRLPTKLARTVTREAKAEQVLAAKEVVFTEEHIVKLRDGLDALLKVTSGQKEARLRLDTEKARRDELRKQHDQHMEVVLKAKADVDSETEAFEAYQAEHTKRLAGLREVFVDQNSTLARIEDDLAGACLEIESIECTIQQAEQAVGTSPEVLALLKGLAGSSSTS